MEPKVVAVATNYAANKLSEPVDGINGVYVFFVTNSVNPLPSKDYADFKERLNLSFKARSYDSYQALIKAAKIEDNRSLFY